MHARHVERGRAAVDEATARLDGLERQRLAQLPDLEAQLVDIYKRGRTGYAKLLFGTTSAREFGRLMVNEGWMVVTGAGGGIMGAPGRLAALEILKDWKG